MKTIREMYEERANEVHGRPINIEAVQEKLQHGMDECVNHCLGGFEYRYDEIVWINDTINYLMDRLKTSETDRFDSHLTYKEKR